MHKSLFILASASPRRLDLLHSIGLKPDKIVPADIDETPLAHELPMQLAQRLARQKLDRVAAQEKEGCILCADTVVAAGRNILPKATSVAEVEFCLSRLNGRRHKVYTSLAVRLANQTILSRTACSLVQFRRLSPAEIKIYAESTEGIGKAGGYAIQGKAACFIKFISGSYSNIVGLPLYDLGQMLNLKEHWD